MAEPDSFMSHLIELRDRLLRCVLALLLVFIWRATCTHCLRNR